MDISIELERIIAIYFNGHNYIVDGNDSKRKIIKRSNLDEGAYRKTWQ